MAKILICENPRMPFGEIADAVGYEDPLYFSKVFRNEQACRRAISARKC